jgi:alkylation response protein AidB-like acyl-CoA dehydrogenase
MSTADVVKPDFATARKHFIFTDEHDQLRESIRRFVAKELAPHADEWEETTFPDAVLARMGELGFLGLDKPEAYGGQGGDYYTALVLAEEMAGAHCGGLAMGVAVQTDMAMPPILAFGTEEQKQQWAAPAIAGRAILCIGITEPDAGSDVAGIKTRAVRDEATGDYVINGAKTYITNGHRAHAIVLVTKTGGVGTDSNSPDDSGGAQFGEARRRARARHEGFTLFLVPMDTPGVIREKRLEKLGMHASDTALLAFQDVRVPESAVLGTVGKGFYHIMWELQGERLIGAAGAVAGAQIVFDRTLQYAKERQAFGRAIGHFQVIRHKFADMATKIETARQMVYTTAWRFRNGEYPVREITMAKLYSARIAVEVADECIQIHGGAGYMQEYGIERAWRDLRLNRIGAGTDEIMLDVIGRSYGL